jgi:4-diphosphocytidyl-2-C-methyl-D-erythritol kinase
MIELKSYAKINLGLEVVGKRKDGYHDLRTIFQTIDLYDTLQIKENKKGTLHIHGNDKTISWDEENTVHKAFQQIYTQFNLNQGFDVYVKKKIQPGSGLGGGSSNAAVILFFLKEYFQLPLNLEDMIAIGEKIGADVPFFLVGGTVLGEGIGEKLTIIDQLEEKDITVVVPKTRVSTSLIFSNLNLTSNGFESKISLFIRTGKLEILENHLEDVTFKLFPELGVIKKRMAEMECPLILMSGSGSSIYCIHKGEDQKLCFDQNNLMESNIFHTKILNRQNYFKRIGAWPSGKEPVFGAGIRRFESSRPREIK